MLLGQAEIHRLASDRVGLRDIAAVGLRGIVCVSSILTHILSVRDVELRQAVGGRIALRLSIDGLDDLGRLGVPWPHVLEDIEAVRASLDRHVLAGAGVAVCLVGARVRGLHRAIETPAIEQGAGPTGRGQARGEEERQRDEDDRAGAGSRLHAHHLQRKLRMEPRAKGRTPTTGVVTEPSSGAGASPRRIPTIRLTAPPTAATAPTP